MLAGRCEVGFVQSRNLKVERGRLRYEPPHTTLVVHLHLLCGSEECHVPAESSLVQDLVLSRVLGKAAQREVDLKVGRPMVDGIYAPHEGIRQVVAIEQPGEGGRRIKVGDHYGSCDKLAVTKLDTFDPSFRRGDSGDLDVTEKLTPVVLEHSEKVFGHGAYAAA